MPNPHNVDICVTCVSDKPPQLPLREELPSLGIEVVYNAEGVAAKTSQDEAAKKALKKIRKQRQQRRRFLPFKKVDPPEIGSLKQMPRPKTDANGTIAGSVDTVGTPTALSYSNYQRSLEKNQEPVGEVSSVNTGESTAASEVDENQPKNNTGNKTNNQRKKKEAIKPPSSVEFTAKADAALQQAFKVFSDEEDVSATPRLKEEESHGYSTNSDPSTLTSLPSRREQADMSKVKVVPSGEARNDFPEMLRDHDDHHGEGLLEFQNDGFTEFKGDFFDSNDGELQKDDEEASASIGQGISSVDARFGGSLSPPTSGGNIKVRLFSHGSNITEMYDLTELSGEESFMPSNSASHRSPSRHIPDSFRSPNSYESSANPLDEDDSRDQLVINLSDVYEENGPGSPLVHSLTPKMNDVQSPPSILRVSRSMSPPQSLTPSIHHVSYNNAQKKDKPLRANDNYEKIHKTTGPIDQREDEEMMESRFDGRSPTERDRYASPRTFGYRESPSRFDRLDVQESLSYQSDQSFPKLQLADSYHPPDSKHDQTRFLSQIDEDNQMGLSPFISGRSLSPSISMGLRSSSRKHQFGSRLIPSLKKNPSHDSRALSRVSFSHDVEERCFYQQDGDGIQYKDSMAEVKAPLAAIIREDQDLNEPLPSALSREADEAFRSLADKLGMEHDRLRSSELMLVEALSYGEPIPFDFEETLKRNPDLAAERLPESDSYALHAACARQFPERFGMDQLCKVRDLVDDVTLHQKLIGSLVSANPNACMLMNGKGDLPAHIMARRLMEWEAQWYQKVYEKAKIEDQDDESGTGITKLYQAMSECMTTLLQPVARNPSLCLQSGSVGRLLPLHIAAIFTVSYKALLSLFEAYPEAASIKCDLSNIRTFIPDQSLPLELHDRLSTDFPKWEIQSIDSDAKDTISQAMLDKTYGTRNGMRRSDLIFAFNPNVLPFRREGARISRMEQRIQVEVMENESLGDFSLSPASSFFWVWMCEFENSEDLSDNYVDSIKRIVQSIPTRAVRFLAGMRNGENKPVVDSASCRSSDVIWERLKQAANTDIPVPSGSLDTGFSTAEPSFILRQLDEDIAKKFCLHGRGFIGPMCRRLFNVSETAFPSSFVLLPYKLVKDENGRLGLDSAKAAQIAMRFADSLLKLTSPTSIIHILDSKATRFTGASLVDNSNIEWWKSQPKIKDYLGRLLSLYKSGPAYFYFLDEYTGVPIVNENDTIYPLIIHEAEDVVRKVFPLMLTGMILMRGEKAVSILANVLLDDNITKKHSHWIQTAKDVVAYLFSPQIEWTKTSTQELTPVREKLLKLIASETSSQNNDNVMDGLSSQWVVETSLIKMVVEMHDTKHDYGGLRARRAGPQVMWTVESAFLNPDSPEYLMQMDFMSAEELKRAAKQQRKSFLATGSSSFDHDERRQSGYAVLFGDLAMTNDDTSSSSDDSDEENVQLKANTRFKPPPVLKMTRSHSQQEALIRSRFSTPKHEAAVSMLDFDDSLDLHDVLKLRIQLDEQEAKLEFLREKITDLEDAEHELLDQEERISDLIGEIINSKANFIESPSKAGLSKARALLLRICDLEERVLCREVEMGQLTNDVTIMEMEAFDSQTALLLAANDSADSQSVAEGRHAFEDGSESSYDYHNTDEEESSLDSDGARRDMEVSF